MSQVSDITRLERAARRAGRRLAAGRALRSAAAWLPLPLGYLAVVLAVVKTVPLSEAQAKPWMLGALVPGLAVMGAAIRAARAGRRAWEGALSLDRHHQLDDRVTNALAFSRVPEPERTPLMQAAIEDAAAHAPALEPARAARIELPRELWLSGLLVLGLAGLAALEVRTLRVVPPPAIKVQPMLLTADDVELFREMAQELSRGADDPQISAAARRFNQLVEDIAARRLDRREVFERLGELERELSEASQIDREALDEGLKSVARELEKSGLTKAAAQALAEQRLADAEKALRELAERLKRKQEAPSKAELEKLRKALEKASVASSESLAAIEQRRKELEEEQKSLLKKKEAGDKSPKVDQKLNENRRKLERLGRDKERAERGKQKLSELDKQLAEAARQLMQDAERAGQSLDAAAEDINRMSKQQLSEEQKKEMLKRLQELREVLRQQGKGGKEQMDRMRRFGERARGGKGQPGEQQAGKPGQPSLRELRLSRSPGDGPGVEVPMPGSGSGSEGKAEGESQSGDQAGKNAGVGHNPNVAGEATDLAGKTRDVSAAGVDSGEGAAIAEVIYGAAERGFVGRGYQKVFTDYQTVAEQVMQQDEIPPGYRFYVRRYFQLIRPRD
jgi:hypothetical protein